MAWVQKSSYRRIKLLRNILNAFARKKSHLQRCARSRRHLTFRWKARRLHIRIESLSCESVRRAVALSTLRRRLAISFRQPLYRTKSYFGNDEFFLKKNVNRVYDCIYFLLFWFCAFGGVSGNERWYIKKSTYRSLFRKNIHFMHERVYCLYSITL